MVVLRAAHQLRDRTSFAILCFLRKWRTTSKTIMPVSTSAASTETRIIHHRLQPELETEKTPFNDPDEVVALSTFTVRQDDPLTAVPTATVE